MEKQTKKLLKEYFNNDRLKYILQENSLGKPLLNDFEFRTSGNKIHHLYHLVKFFKETSTRETDFKKVLEIGGGYGNMALLFSKINENITYTIIDIPIFSYIQFIYLKTLLNKKVVLLNKNEEIVKNAINIVPLDQDSINYIYKETKPDLLISTWALSETNERMQKLIQDLDYFESKFLLLAYQKVNKDFSFSENINYKKESYDKIYNEETDYIKNNYYLFEKRK